jgi:hypothetical protein
MEREAYMDTDTSRMNTHAQEHKNTGWDISQLTENALQCTVALMVFTK